MKRNLADNPTGPDEGGADLAGFISEMRAELEALRKDEAQLDAILAAQPATTTAPTTTTPAA
mgnify:CR=1 FL=1